MLSNCTDVLQQLMFETTTLIPSTADVPTAANFSMSKSAALQSTLRTLASSQLDPTSDADSASAVTTSHVVRRSCAYCMKRSCTAVRGLRSTLDRESERNRIRPILLIRRLTCMIHNVGYLYRTNYGCSELRKYTKWYTSNHQKVRPYMYYHTV